MNTRWMVWMLAGLVLPAMQLAAQEQGSPVLVEKVYGKPAAFDLQEGSNRFVRLDRALDANELVGVRVLEVSRKGYALLDLPGGRVWVDKLSLRFNTAVPNAYCGRLGGDSSVSFADDVAMNAVRGAGEGCR